MGARFVFPHRESKVSMIALAAPLCAIAHKGMIF
jgi:hypothetical protein